MAPSPSLSNNQIVVAVPNVKKPVPLFILMRALGVVSDKDIIEKHPWDVAIGGRFNPSSTYTVIGNLSSALLNIPLDRALAEARGISEMLDDRNTTFQRIALGLGWRTWDVGTKNEEFDLIKSAAKKEEKKKKSNSKKARTTSRTSTRN